MQHYITLLKWQCEHTMSDDNKDKGASMNGKPPVDAADTAASTTDDHPFVPKGEWWSLCAHPGCNLAESRHKTTTITHPPS